MLLTLFGCGEGTNIPKGARGDYSCRTLGEAPRQVDNESFTLEITASHLLFQGGAYEITKIDNRVISGIDKSSCQSDAFFSIDVGHLLIQSCGYNEGSKATLELICKRSLKG
jgi:hypothetical protein